MFKHLHGQKFTNINFVYIYRKTTLSATPTYAQTNKITHPFFPVLKNTNIKWC